MQSGYSGTPLIKKLGYKEGFRYQWINAPEHYPDLLGELPPGCIATAEQHNLVHLFTKEEAVLREQLPQLMERIDRDGMIWVSWPKKASKVPTDVTENDIRAIALPLGLVDVKVCAVDEVWSGLKLVIRKELR